KQAYNEEVLIKRAVKEAIHEMGHVLGLKHCENPECVMSFSNTVFDVDRKTKNLCEKCKKQLKI
ncbi:MAG: matrixin family metalloprotease, partial [Candidatus Aenigmarchaeota archaeon]|nr:matrixin family metalloprotease [Candidatus Aenigmarchaeota archaeon]